MKEFDLEKAWTRVHNHENKRNLSLREFRPIIRKSHSNLIHKIMKEVKLKIIVFFISLLIMLGMCGYAFVFLGIRPSTELILPFSVAGVFILFLLTSEINRYSLLNQYCDECTINESSRYIWKTLNRILRIDFYVNLFFCYGLSLIFIVAFYYNWIDLQHFIIAAQLKGLFFVFAGLLLILPWLIKNFIKQRYKTIRSNILHSLEYLNQEASV